MSYSQNVKNELVSCMDTAKHCMIAELCGIFSFVGSIEEISGEQGVRIRLESENIVRKCFTLAVKSFNIKGGAYPLEKQGFILKGQADTELFRQGMKLSSNTERMALGANPLLLRHKCCMRAFLRGAFLAAGSMSDPESSYHLEFVCGSEALAMQLSRVLGELSLPARTVKRKGRMVVYIKDSSGIVELLGVMGAHRSYMDLENLRILKEMRGSINRRVNCETANISKTVTASSKQIEDIILIRDQRGLSSLPGNLLEIAALRLEYPDVTLKELGQLLNPGIGKSGVNHRLRKISEIADEIRDSLPDELL